MNVGYVIDFAVNNFHNFDFFKWENDTIFITIDNEKYIYDLEINDNFVYDYDINNYKIKKLSHNSFICSQ